MAWDYMLSTHNKEHRIGNNIPISWTCFQNNSWIFQIRWNNKNWTPHIDVVEDQNLMLDFFFMCIIQWAVHNSPWRT